MLCCVEPDEGDGRLLRVADEAVRGPEERGDDAGGPRLRRLHQTAFPELNYFS
jgi:hypothetical protein